MPYQYWPRCLTNTGHDALPILATMITERRMKMLRFNRAQVRWLITGCFHAHIMLCTHYVMYTLCYAHIMLCTHYVMYTLCFAHIMLCTHYVMQTLCYAHIMLCTLYVMHTLWDGHHSQRNSLSLHMTLYQRAAGNSLSLHRTLYQRAAGNPDDEKTANVKPVNLNKYYSISHS